MLEQYNPTVLMVEPSRHFVSLLRHILSVGGVKHTHHAGDAYGALEVIKADHVDILLLDSDISGITSVELTRVIRSASDSPNQNLPIIFLSDCPTRRLIDTATQAGVNYYVRKPVSAQTLLQRMKWALDAERQRIAELRQVAELQVGLEPAA
jgi:CheY-like chemotaxis protein